VLIVLAGLLMNTCNTAANSLLQFTAGPRLRGQTVSLYLLAMRGGLPVGSVANGLSVYVFGVRDALLANGIIVVAAHLLNAHHWRRSSRSAHAWGYARVALSLRL
jgi:hypothetical protein